MSPRKFVLNSPVLTGYGSWRFDGPLDMERARRFLSRDEFISAVGHAASAAFLSSLLGIEIPVNRIRAELQPGDRALVLRLKERFPEGRVLSLEEMNEFPFELGILTRLDDATTDLASEFRNLLAGIHILPRRLQLRTDAPPEMLQVPMLRSVWGKVLHTLSPEAYDKVFHPSGHGRRPMYVLRPAPVDPQCAPAFDWISIGPALEYDKTLLQAWDAAGEAGVGKKRDPFVMERCLTLGPDESIRDDGASWPLSECSWPADDGDAPVRLHFVTPLSLMREHSLITDPAFDDIISRACRRLGEFLPDEQTEWSDISRRAVMLAKEIPTSAWIGEQFQLKRYSASQQKEFRVSGVCGYLDLPEGPGDLWPILAAIQWIHLGKSTNVGLGQLQVEPLIETKAV